MYCINFQRSSLRIDRNRRNHRRSDLRTKTKQQSPPKRSGNETSYQLGNKKTIDKEKKSSRSLYKSEKNVSRNLHKNDMKRQHRSMTQGRTHEFDDGPNIRSTVTKAANPKVYNLSNRYSDTRIEKLEKEQRQQEIDDSSELNLTIKPLLRNNQLISRNEADVEKDFKSKQRDYMQPFRASGPFEEKRDYVSDLLSRNHAIWTNQSTSSGNYQERSISSHPAVQKIRTQDLSQLREDPLVSTSHLHQRQEKPFTIDNVDRDNNLTKRNEFKNKSFQRKAFGRSPSTKNDIQQMKKLVQEATHYRIEFEAGEKKRQQLEEELEKTRQENQKYAEQMDVLIFEYIPKVVPKFKEIGPVDYDIKESFNFVDPYHLLEIIGEGHYGSVRRGTHKKSQQRFAIKILKKSNINRFTDVKQIAIEIHVLKTYRHPNIIHLQEVIHAADNIYMITELCSMDLHKYLNEIGITIASARQVIYGILKPLCHLHLHGICHLDLKPENILLTKPFDSFNATHQHVRICDFGLVDITRNSGANKDVIREGYVCGTPGFYAPEMILQDRFEGRSADMVSTI